MSFAAAIYRVLPWLCLTMALVGYGVAVSTPPKSFLDTFVPGAYQGKWFIDLYTVKPIPDLRGCLSYSVRISNNPNKVKAVISYVTLSNTTKEMRVTITAVKDQVGFFVVTVGKERIFESVVLNTDYGNYTLLWLRAGQKGDKHDTIVVSSRPSGAWKSLKSDVDADLRRANTGVTTDEMGVIDNVEACTIIQAE